MSSREQLAEKIMVALDYPTAEKAEQLIQQLKGIPCYMKVGMQLFYAEGPGIVVQLKEQGYKVFLDLKLHDIPNTVKGTAESLTRLGIDMFNVHAGGGRAMMEAAREGMERALGSGQTRPWFIGVTQLTSTSREVLNKEIGIEGTVEEAVIHYAGLARKAGLDGVVASPLEVAYLKETFGPSILTVTPGIRPRGTAIGDQTRIMTPEEAIHAGTDYMVIGRPITAAPEPRAAMENILDSLLD
ncbi:orotidine-5'-phosphate decarboxylase [Paenibacillus larvae]|uniref:Orotidine 5'-phosphate decarboxylase n=1 Tax=Paenibacillus larvae TaxID=1464 RepID=A0AAP5JW72_9BACL|nr:orotidine-5'-phosphate decarboxylase [Paenibacillus larvae]AQR77302.1 orotidine 5'-phosphate decarboxylase [Paenibacillus larvae subsp. larvae]AVF21704.1 orotidine 5'-phosphate decarboxylase PyrF [Paenibacillus larvae subsp. larvae]ETK27603.1 orotidine 5'-phosphate decarboxylase PyrF [Paenibacillus larvae subsp. larvae DSM 25719]MDE5125612.1 orotidine-5'-phosphate decarboxylase [Paenibacillus larvae subsp. larvae]MDE5134728.1 orotidine-5'-phosphate decarboxylase [Paenibacillus larvae subsp.